MRKTLIDKWFDAASQVQNYIYKFENGLPIVISTTPIVTTSYIDIGLLGGYRYELLLDVPVGTAHFLEHVLVGNPNQLLRTPEQVRRYRMGSKVRPGVARNGSTSVRYMRLLANTHQRFTPRAIKFIKSWLEQNETYMGKALEKERQIILSEEARELRPEKDEGYQMRKFVNAGIFPEFNERLIGTQETIKAIQLEDLVKMKKAMLHADQAVLCFHAPRLPNKEEWKDLANLAAQFSPESGGFKPPLDPQQKFKYQFGHFHNERKQDVHFSMNFPIPYIIDNDYYKKLCQRWARALIAHVGYEYVREEKHLVYEFNFTSSMANYFNEFSGIRFSGPADKFTQILEAVHEVIFTRCREYLFSTEGQQWLNSKISNYVFPGNLSVNEDYAYEVGIAYLLGRAYDFDNRAANRAARKVTREAIWNALEELISKPPLVWTASNNKYAEVIAAWQDSKLHSHFSKSHGEVEIGRFGETE